MNTIDIRWIMRQMPLAILFAFVLALASGGCAERLDGPPSGDDTSIPSIETDTDSISPTHTVSCKLGVTVGLGSSGDWDISIAGGHDGYAVTYREAGGLDPVVMLLDSEGNATGPATILPPSNFSPYVVHGSDGYAVKSGGNDSNYLASIYKMTQGGEIGSVARNFYPAGKFSVTESGLMRGYTIIFDQGCSGQGQWMFRIAVWTTSGDGSFRTSEAGPCLNGIQWPRSFAAHDNSAIIPTHEEHAIGNDGDYNSSFMVNTMVGGDVVRFELDTGYRFGTSTWRFANVLNTIATEDGYAILWYRQAVHLGMLQESWFLSFIGEDGNLRATREVGDYANDIAWNGREFGLVRGDIASNFQNIIFERLDRRGEVFDSMEFSGFADSRWSHHIAASDRGYAVTYGVQVDGQRLEEYFTPIVCD